MGVLGGGTKTAYDAEFTESVQTLEHTKKFMEKCIGGIQNSIKDYNSSNSVNRYEKIGDAINKYGAKCIEAEVAGYLQSGKAAYDQVGRAYRVYASQVTEKVIEPLVTWVKVDYKAIRSEISKLDKARKDMDNAADKSRKMPNDGELESRKAESESAHEAQMQVTKDALAKIAEHREQHLAILTEFAQMQSKLQQDAREPLDAYAQQCKW